MTDSYSVTEDNAAATPGQKLHAAREAAGFSVQYVAEQLRLTESYIAWLETDQYESLPAEPFVLGYYRAYARVLSISADELINTYHQYRGQLSKTGDEAVKLGRRRESKQALKEDPLGVAPEPNRANRNYLIAAAVLILIWIAVSLLSGEQPASTVNSSEPVNHPVATQLASESQASAQLDTAIESAGEKHSDTSLPKSDEVLDLLPPEEGSLSDLATPEAELSIEGMTNSEQPVSNGLDQLVVSFGEECWLEITDSQGDVVAADLYQKDDLAKIQGVAPFTVMLGNVRAANMTVNNIPVEASPRGFRKTLRVYVYGDGSTKAID